MNVKYNRSNCSLWIGCFWTYQKLSYFRPSIVLVLENCRQKKSGMKEGKTNSFQEILNIYNVTRLLYTEQWGAVKGLWISGYRNYIQLYASHGNASSSYSFQRWPQAETEWSELEKCLFSLRLKKLACLTHISSRYPAWFSTRHEIGIQENDD